MTLDGLPPRAAGETLGPVCQTGQRRRLSAVPFLKALPWLLMEYLMWQREVGDVVLWRRMLHRRWTPGAQRMPAPTLPR